MIFVNGFMPMHWARQDNHRFVGICAGTYANPNYRPYPGSRSMTNNYPQYFGKSFDYLGNIDDAFMQGYNDKNSMYINASSDNTSKASDRFAEGEVAGYNLISQLDNGKISLANGETIKIVGHSQGGAFAAGMSSVLSKSQKYVSVLQEVVYLEPHQPADFSHPPDIRVRGIQISSAENRVASIWNLFGFLKGKTSFDRISGVNNFIENKTHKGDRLGGHSVGTNLDEIVEYFRGKGVKITDLRW